MDREVDVFAGRKINRKKGRELYSFIDTLPVYIFPDEYYCYVRKIYIYPDFFDQSLHY